MLAEMKNVPAHYGDAVAFAFFSAVQDVERDYLAHLRAGHLFAARRVNVRRAVALCKSFLDSGFYALRFGVQSERAGQHHCRGENGCDRVGNILARDVGCAAVYGLV